MDHAVQRGRIERSVEGKRLEDIGLDGRDFQALQAPGGMNEDVRIGAEDGDGGTCRQAGSFQEVAGARADVQMPRTDVPPVSVHQKRGWAAPHRPGEEAEDDGVVDLEEERRVLALARIAGIVRLHRALPRLLHSASSQATSPRYQHSSRLDAC
jgi:hypothetical protein